MIIKRKNFSLIKKVGYGIKGAVKSLKYSCLGAAGGALLAFLPALIARIFGKKGFIITEAIGAGLGLGFLMYIGYKNGIEKYENEELKKDPKFREKKAIEDKKELEKYLENKSNYSIPNSRTIIDNFQKIEKKFNISFKEDLFKYIKFYESFYKKYYKKWYEVYKTGCTSLKDIDIEFNYIFPEPVFDFDTLSEEIEATNKDCGLVLGSFEYSDHGFLYYHFKDKTYSFDLGYGYDSDLISKTLTDRCKTFRSFYDLSKTDEAYLVIVKTHTDIINKFIEGLKSL